ncbi:hypothetical protein Aca07nite_27350 [Actinoplanes capillaceus]|uniref:Uncharacterized protein n=1 Tax=Actinoplanes campanulatus TaxID=113559 RepID=A0ABQ3WGU2_9ACTN|nr:hypothetical protein Aca07nite_27350 [Actinoplanes capillaceus]
MVEVRLSLTPLPGTRDVVLVSSGPFRPVGAILLPARACAAPAGRRSVEYPRMCHPVTPGWAHTLVMSWSPTCPITVVAVHAATCVCGHHRFDDPIVRTHPR